MSINGITIPEFEPYIVRNGMVNCKVLDVQNIVAEILGGEFVAKSEVQGSFLSEKVLIDGDFAILLRYKRESDLKTHPAIVMGYDIKDGKVLIRHIQGIRDGKVSYRFNRGFNSFKFFLDFLKQNYIAKGVKVELVTVPEGLEGASYGARSGEKYSLLGAALQKLNEGIIDSIN